MSGNDSVRHTAATFALLAALGWGVTSVPAVHSPPTPTPATTSDDGPSPSPSADAASSVRQAPRVSDFERCTVTGTIRAAARSCDPTLRRAKVTDVRIATGGRWARASVAATPDHGQAEFLLVKVPRGWHVERFGAGLGCEPAPGLYAREMRELGLSFDC